MDMALRAPIRPRGLDRKHRCVLVAAERPDLDPAVPDLGALHGRARVAAPMRLGIQRLEARKMQNNPFPDFGHSSLLVSAIGKTPRNRRTRRNFLNTPNRTAFAT